MVRTVDFHQRTRVNGKRNRQGEHSLIPSSASNTLSWRSDRPGKMSISPVLQKILTYNIARLAKLILGCIENDAIGCYDRIANPLGYIALHRLGMFINAIIFLALTWSKMVHVIRTAYTGNETPSIREVIVLLVVY